jgi:hypothetical protein
MAVHLSVALFGSRPTGIVDERPHEVNLVSRKGVADLSAPRGGVHGVGLNETPRRGKRDVTGATARTVQILIRGQPDPASWREGRARTGRYVTCPRARRRGPSTARAIELVVLNLFEEGLVADAQT